MWSGAGPDKPSTARTKAEVLADSIRRPLQGGLWLPLQRRTGGSNIVPTRCRACRGQRNACIRALGATKCTRCEAIGVLCVSIVTPRNGPQIGEEVAFDGPGKYFREIACPTTMHRTRLAVAQLLDDLENRDSHYGEVSGQLRIVIILLMRRARASSDLAELHAAVSLATALHLDEAIDPFVDDDSYRELRPDQVAALVDASESEVSKQCAVEGGDRTAAVMRSIHDSTGFAESGNELFCNCFFDPVKAGFHVSFFDICNTIVGEESQHELRRMHNEIAQFLLYRPPQLLPDSKTWHITVASSQSLVLQGHMGERITGLMRLHAFVADEGKAVVEYVVITTIQRLSATPKPDNGSSGVAALQPQRFVAAAKAGVATEQPPQRRPHAVSEAKERQLGDDEDADEEEKAQHNGQDDRLTIPLPMLGDRDALTPLHGEAGDLSCGELRSLFF